MKEEVPGKKYFIAFFIILVLLLGAVGIGFLSLGKRKLCSDGTPYEYCSKNPPYYCYKGKLIKDASLCGCPSGWEIYGKSCESKYMVDPKQVTFNFSFNGQEKAIDFVLFKGVYDYLVNEDRKIEIAPGKSFSRRDFKLKTINERVQKDFLIPFVVKLQNKYPNSRDQVRVIFSLIQNIPYRFSNKSIDFFGTAVNYSRYPYEVLYENAGICSERVDLLAFILRELGYGVVIFYFPEEDHEGVGIRCPKSSSFDNTGYCYVETTKLYPFDDIWDSSPHSYGLSNNYEIILISEGKTFRKENNLI